MKSLIITQFISFIISSITCSIAFAEDPLPGELIIKFRNSVRESTKTRLHKRTGAHHRRIFRKNTETIQIQSDQDLNTVLRKYKNDPNIEYAEPNYLVQAMTTVPNDSLYSQQWGLKNSGQTVSQTTAASLVPNFTGWYGSPWSASSGAANPGTADKDLGMEEAWDILTDCRTNKSGSQVVVGVVDSGINYNHPDLVDNMWDGGTVWPNHGKNFLSSDTGGDLLVTNDPMDQNGHGTSMAGIIAARGNNGKGSSGICWRANLLAAKAMNHSGVGSIADISSGIDYAVANGAKVINLSLGFRGGYSSTLESSIINARNHGVLLITAAGNDAQDNDLSSQWPCNYSTFFDNVVCVGAVDQAGDLGVISAYGGSSVQVGAPGINIVTLADGLTTITTPTLGVSSTLNQWRFTNQLGTTITNGWSYVRYGTNPAILRGSFPGSGTPSLYSVLLQIGNFDLTTMTFTATTPYPANSTLRAYNTVGDTLSRSSIYDIFEFCYYKKHELATGDSVSFGYRASSTIGDPFYGTPAATIPDVMTGNNETFSCFSAPTCLDNTCSFGFSANTLSAATTANGLIIWQVKATRKTPDTLTTAVPTTNISTGTSDSTAFVTGLAAMLFANNDDTFTYLDVKNALLKAGTPLTSLTGKTSTGKMVHALNSLKYIEAPKNVTASMANRP